MIVATIIRLSVGINLADDKPEVPGAKELAEDSLETQTTEVTENTTNSGVPAKGVASQNLGPGEKAPLYKRLEKFTKGVNIYLIAFGTLIVISILVGFVAYQTGQKSQEGLSIDDQGLSDEALKELVENDVNVGDVSQTLTVEANSIFNGKVLVKDNLDVAGTINVGGALSLPGITVAGNSSFENIEVSNNLAILGNANVTGTMTIQQNLNVSGSTTIEGALSASSIVTDNLQFTGDLNISRHIDTSGGTPSATKGGSVGSGGTISISGTDTAGTVTINTGSGASSGTLVNITFASAFTKTPNVILSPSSSSAAKLDYYASRSSSGFSLNAASTPSASSTYVFDYIIFE